MTAEPRSHSGVVVFPRYWAQRSGSGPMACRPRSVSGLSECGCFRRQPAPAQAHVLIISTLIFTGGGGNRAEIGKTMVT